MKISVPPSVIQYFNDHWHPIWQQWVMGMKYSSGNFLNGTNNRLECIIQKLKSVISRYSSLEDFVANFFLILRVMHSERDHKAALIVLKVPIAFHDTSSMKYLTPYSYRFIAKQISLIDKVKLKDIDGEQSFHTSSSEGERCLSCTCMFWQSIKLPCRHIFAARSKLDLNLFNEGLCDRQWSAEYFQHNQRIFCSDFENYKPSFSVMELPPPQKKTLSQV